MLMSHWKFSSLLIWVLLKPRLLWKLRNASNFMNHNFLGCELNSAHCVQSQLFLPEKADDHGIFGQNCDRNSALEQLNLTIVDYFWWIWFCFFFLLIYVFISKGVSDLETSWIILHYQEEVVKIRILPPILKS